MAGARVNTEAALVVRAEGNSIKALDRLVKISRQR